MKIIVDKLQGGHYSFLSELPVLREFKLKGKKKTNGNIAEKFKFV